MSAANTLGGLYAGDQNRQLQGAALAPTMAGMDYTDLAKLQQTGAFQEDQYQRELNDQVARHNFEQQEPWDRLNRYAGLLTGNYGGSSTGTNTGTYQPARASQMQGALGGAATGASMGAMAGPWGALAGGVLGGLGGAFL